MMNRRPFFTVIIPTYNRAHTLKRAIDSVLHQSYPYFHLIVVDDASTDSTADLLNSYKSQITVLTQTVNLGVSTARNLGIKHALSDPPNSCDHWISFLDSDDEWMVKKLEWTAAKIAEAPEISVVHGDEQWIRNGVRVNQHKKHQKYGGFIFHAILPLCLISPSAVAIRATLLQSVGLFDEAFTVCEDYEMWLRICTRFAVSYIEWPIIKKYGGHDDQLSHRYFAMDYWRILALDRILVLHPHLPFHMRQAIIETIQKKGNILIRGYEKHNNLENYQTVATLLQKHRLN